MCGGRCALLGEHLCAGGGVCVHRACKAMCGRLHGAPHAMCVCRGGHCPGFAGARGWQRACVCAACVQRAWIAVQRACGCACRVQEHSGLRVWMAARPRAWGCAHRGRSQVCVFAGWGVCLP